MPRITGTTDAQTTFLRAFRHNPTGPAPADWPTPTGGTDDDRERIKERKSH